MLFRGQYFLFVDCKIVFLCAESLSTVLFSCWPCFLWTVLFVDRTFFVKSAFPIQTVGFSRSLFLRVVNVDRTLGVDGTSGAYIVSFHRFDIKGKEC